MNAMDQMLVYRLERGADYQRSWKVATISQFQGLICLIFAVVPNDLATNHLHIRTTSYVMISVQTEENQLNKLFASIEFAYVIGNF